MDNTAAARSKEEDASHKDGGDTKDKNPLEIIKQSELEKQVLISQKDEAAVVATSCSGEIESKLSSTAENDDLLDKIEEVCKDSTKQTISSTSEDISQTSDNDFLKKLEEIEEDGNVDKTSLVNSEVEPSVSVEKPLQTCNAETVTKDIDENKSEISSSSEDKANLSSSQDKEIKEIIDSKDECKSLEICEADAISKKDDKTGEQTTLNKSDETDKSSVQILVNDELTNKSDDKNEPVMEGVLEAKKKIPEEKNVSHINLPKDEVTSAEKSKTEAINTDSLESKLDKDCKVFPNEKKEAETSEENPESSKITQEKYSIDTPVAKSDTEPMSVDASEENTMEIMDVDDDKMEVDVEDTENDEEMTAIREDKDIHQVPKEVKATEDQEKNILQKDEIIREKLNTEVTSHNQANISCIDLTETPKKGDENNKKIFSQSSVVEIISDDDEDITPKDVKTSSMAKECKTDDTEEKDTEKGSVVSLNETDDNKVLATSDDTKSEPCNKDKDITSSLPTEETKKKKKSVDVETTEKKTDNVTSDELRLSDSTASLSNTSDEQLMIKFSTEHTVDQIDTDKKTNIDTKLPINALKHGSSIPSLNNSPVTTTTSNVFNSTPIQKQFEISSENVSKISEPADNSQRDKTIHEEDEKHHNIKESETSESETCTPSETEPQSSDTVTKYIKVIKQYNGIADDVCTTTDEDDTTSKIKVQNIPKLDLQSESFSNGDPSTKEDIKTESVYEVNVWYEETEIKYLSVERLDPKKSDGRSIDVTSSSGDTSAKGSSNGSVTSLPPFTLPAARLSEISSCGSTSTSSQKTLDGKFTIPSQPKKIRHTVKGISDLCNFMIEQFGKIKQTINIDTSTQTATSMQLIEPKTPERKTKDSLSSKKSRTKDESTSPELGEIPTTSTAVASTSAQKTTGKRAPKRSLAKTNSDDDDDDDDDVKPKAKQSKKSQSTTTTKSSPYTPVKGTDGSTTTTDIKSDDNTTSLSHCVLAKWVDKKFYAGKITDTKTTNKFVVLFEDGASKVLPKESIVFGDVDGTLPLKDQSVHALVDDDYESGIVMDIQKVDNKIMYTVKAETSTVQLTASDLYLQDDQAKIIQNLNKEADKKYVEELFKKAEGSLRSDTPVSSARPTRNKRVSVSPAAPEAGFSGGITKKGGKRQKRYS